MIEIGPELADALKTGFFFACILGMYYFVFVAGRD